VEQYENTGRRLERRERRQPFAEPGSAGRERKAARGVSFEEAQRELESIVERLERGQASLDEAIALWERGEELLQFCLARLDAAQGRIEELARRAEGAAPFPGSEASA
jgi:exodeoxyribonuclease VII small subunit